MSINLYQLVLLLFPADFRRRHGVAMVEQFNEQRRLVKSRPLAAIALWIRAITDAIRHGLALRFSGPDHTPKPSSLPSDLRQAWRSVVSRRTSSSLSIALLALALTVSTTIFCIVDSVILRPAPFPEPHNLFELYTGRSATQLGQPYMPPDVALLWEQQTDMFDEIGTFEQGGSALLGGAEEARELVGQVYVTPGFFRVFRVPLLAGRWFAPGEGAPGNDRVAVISEKVWRSRFDRDPGAIGRPILVNDVPLTIIGVMPATFGYPWNGIRVWRPLDLAHSQPNRYAQVVLRARRDMNLDTLRERVGAAAAVIFPQASKPMRYPTATVRPMSEPQLEARTIQSLWLLAGATLMLLVTAGANLSSLSLAQLVARTRDAAIQSALGATRFRLMRQALAEQALMGVIALAIAAPLTWLAISVAHSLMPERLTNWTMNMAQIDQRAALVMAGLAFGTPILAGLIPAFAGSKTSVVELLKHEGRASTSGRGSRLLRRLLVVTEIVCAVVLLVVGALLVRSFMRLQAVDRGFDTSRLVYAHMNFPARDFPSPMSRRLFVDRALEELAATPGVSGVTLTSGLPPEGNGISFGKLSVEGREPSPSAPTIELPMYTVRPDFFSITGIPILQGRPFRDDEPKTSTIISASMAAAYWPGTSPIGQRWRLGEEWQWQEVVGVAGEVRSSGLDDRFGSFETYYPYARPAISAVSGTPVESVDAFAGSGAFIIRTDDGARAIAPVRAALAKVDRRVMVDKVARVEDLYGQTLSQQRMLLVLMIVFSGAGLVIAGIGVYGVLSGIVAQQLREIGVRIMLGAEPAAMSRLVFRNGLWLAAIGGVIGIAVAALSGRMISSVLFDVRASDITSYAIVLAVLGLAVILAAWRPARRASRVDPATLLRDS